MMQAWADYLDKLKENNKREYKSMEESERWSYFAILF